MSEMADEEVNVRLAILCGWTLRDDLYFHESNPKMGRFSEELPRYCSSLDEVAKVEAGLTQTECFVYRELLQQMVLKPVALSSTDFVFGATAPQRARALLATLQSRP